MINRPITLKSPELEANLAAYVYTFIRVQYNVEGMLEHLAKMSDRFTPEQFEIIEILGGEVAQLFIAWCDQRGLEPVEAYEKMYYQNWDHLPVEDYV